MSHLTPASSLPDDVASAGGDRRLPESPASAEVPVRDGTPVPARRVADRRGGGAGDGRPRRPDRALHLLLLAAEREARLGVTVCSGGVVVSGRLVSTRGYARALADHFASATGTTAMDPVFAEAFGELVDDATNVAQGDRRATPDAAAYELAMGFIHLTEARIVSGAGVFPHGRHGVLWRCRVDDVDGWAVGEAAA